MDNDKRKRLLITVAGVCVGLWMADTFVFEPLLDIWSTRSARIEELEQNIAKAGSLLDREPSLKARWKDMKKRALPNRVSDAETALLQSVNRWTADSKLSVTSVKPRWNPSGKEAQTLEIQLEGTGNIDSVTKFVYDLESDSLPLRVEDLEVVSQDEKGTHLNLTLRFTGLVFNEETAPPKEAGTRSQEPGARSQESSS